MSPIKLLKMSSVLLVLAFSSAAFARGDTPTPQPSPEIKKLIQAFSGTWSITLKVEPSKSLPKGGGGKGEEVWRPGPGGLSLIEDYHSTGDEGEISGLGLAWWDISAQHYRVLWCDNSPTSCAIMEDVKWEGAQMVAMLQWEQDGKKLTFREVFSDITPTSFKQTLYLGESGTELKMIETISATKVSSAALPRSSPSQMANLKMPGPAAQNDMLGTFSVKVKYEPSPEKPKGSTGEGTEVWWAGPGGDSVIEEYYQNDANESIAEFVPAWWDTPAGGQRFVYCGSTVPDGCWVSKNVATWEGNDNVYSEERSEGGKKMTEMEIFKDILPGSFTQVFRGGESGTELKTRSTMWATKVSSTPQLRDWGK